MAAAYRVKKEPSTTRTRNYEYIAEPDSALKCQICQEVAVRPLQEVSCGKLFCTKCLGSYGRRSRCLGCGDTQPLYFSDTRGSINIRGLPVKCNDCKCQVAAGNLEAHMGKCDSVLLPCPKKCKKNNDKIAHFMKKDLAKHLENDCPNRDFKCSHCEVEGPYAHMVDVHEPQCIKRTVTCPNTDCTEVMAHQVTRKHLQECDYSKVPCKFQKLGCYTRVARKDIVSHEEDDKLHLRMALDVVNSTILNKHESMTFKVTEFTTKKDTNAVFYSPTFYSSSNGYHFKVAVYPNGLCDGMDEYVSVYLYVIKGKCDDKLNWPLVANVTFEVLNQIENQDHHKKKMSIQVEDNMVVGENMGYSIFIHHSHLEYVSSHKKCRKQHRYLKDNSLFFRVSIDMPTENPWLDCTV